MKKSSGNSQNEMVKECIFTALMLLMEERNFNEISITDITRKAGVSRISYYRNYNSKEEIITNYIDDIFQDFLQNLEGAEFDVYNNMRMFFESNRKNKQLIMNLVRSNMSNLLFERYKNYFHFVFEMIIKKKRSTTSSLARKYEVSYLVGGLYEIMIQWVKSGLIETDEQMASVLFELTQ